MDKRLSPVMNRKRLLKRIRARARELGLPRGDITHAGSHDKVTVGNSFVIIPRHKEIAEMTAEGIMKSLEPTLGKDWWRND